ncbi:hypothetical protein ACLB2K_017365 [Fragaria x ananassa]
MSRVGMRKVVTHERLLKVERCILPSFIARGNIRKTLLTSLLWTLSMRTGGYRSSSTSQTLMMPLILGKCISSPSTLCCATASSAVAAKKVMTSAACMVTRQNG